MKDDSILGFTFMYPLMRLYFLNGEIQLFHTKTQTCNQNVRLLGGEDNFSKVQKSFGSFAYSNYHSFQ